MQLYKPNKANKGSAISINFSAKTDKDGQKGDKSFYFQLIQQTGWDESKQTGTFKDGKKITVKFAPHEVAGILSAIDKNTALEKAMNVKYVYHDGADSATTIYFAPHFKKEKQGDTWTDTTLQLGFSLRVVKTSKANKEEKDQLSIGFTWAEAELLKLYLRYGLSHIFDAFYSENVSRGKEKAKKYAEAKTANTNKPAESKTLEPEASSVAPEQTEELDF